MGVPSVCFLLNFWGSSKSREIGLRDSGGFYLPRRILGGTCLEVALGGKYGFPAACTPSQVEKRLPGAIYICQFYVLSLSSVCICPISAGGFEALPLSQMGRTDAAAKEASI